MALDLSVLKPLVKPLAKELLDKVIFPLLRAEEAKISNVEIKAFVDAIEPLLEKAIDDYLSA